MPTTKKNVTPKKMMQATPAQGGTGTGARSGPKAKPAAPQAKSSTKGAKGGMAGAS